MTLAEVQRLVAQGESETLEFKRSTGQLSRAGAAICGMLNRAGGVVLIGVTDAGEVVGQQVADSTLRDIATVLADFEPDAPVRIERIELSPDRAVLALHAYRSPGRGPWAYRGRPWQRVGTTRTTMPQATYQRLLLERAHATHRWELAEVPELALADLDTDEILKTVRLGIEAGRLPESTGSDIADILERLDLTSRGLPVRAAIVLFARRVTPLFPQCALRLARFRGVTKDEFIDERQLRGNAFSLLDAAMEFMLRHIPIAGRFPRGTVVRRDEPLFPVAALREAVVNALIHRDYSAPGGSVSIAIFDDRLEVWSTGTLPPGLSAAELKYEHLSKPPNPTIADVFYRRGLIEQWGRGTQNIVRLCVAAGNHEPEFEETAGAVCVRFIPKGHIGARLPGAEIIRRQWTIAAILERASSPLSFSEIRSALGEAPSDRTVRNDLLALRKAGLVRLEGHGRGARWAIERSVESGNE